MIQNPLDAARQTGRTTRMIYEARRISSTGIPVIVLVQTHNHARWIEDKFGLRDEPRIKVLSKMRVHSEEIIIDYRQDTLVYRGAEHRLLIDPSLIEYEFKYLLDLLFRWNAKQGEYGFIEYPRFQPSHYFMRKAPSHPDDWQWAQDICNTQAVDTAIRGFVEDQTGDNAIMIVREVMRASAAAALPPSPAQGDAVDAARMNKLLQCCTEFHVKYHRDQRPRQMTMVIRDSVETSSGFRKEMRKAIDQFSPIAIAAQGGKGEKA